MTKEQAITRVKHSSLYIHDRETADYIIKALEQNEVLQKENEDFRNYIDTVNHTNSQLIQLIEKHKMNRDTSDDCVSRQAVLDCLTATGLKKFDFILDAREKVNNLSSVIPTQGMCKDCEQSQCLGEECYCNNVDEYFDKDFYCADFEKRSDEDEKDTNVVC